MSFDPLGKILTELRDDSAVAALTTRIRGGEPSPGDSRTPFQRFVVLARLGGELHRSVPIQDVLLGLRCYGTSAQDAATLFGACADALHHIGPRLAAAGGIYISHVPQVGTAENDPATHQPYELGTIELIATAQAVTA